MVNTTSITRTERKIHYTHRYIKFLLLFTIIIIRTLRGINRYPASFIPYHQYNRSREESFKRRYFLPEIPFCEMDTEVLLSSITSPHNFSVQFASSSGYLSSLLEALDKTYSDPKIKDCVEWNIYSPKIGMFGLYFLRLCFDELHVFGNCWPELQ